MKRIILSLLAVTSIVSCNKVGDNEFIIAGNAEGVKDGVEVYLQKQDSTGKLVQLDTVKVEKGKFKFEGDFVEPGLHFIEVKETQGKVVLVLENGEITVDVKKDSINKSKVGGTYSNDQLAIYSKEYEKIQKKMMEFQQANMEKWQQAQATQDTVTRNALMKENKVYQDQFLKLTNDHVEKHPKSYLSLLFIGQLINQPNGDIAKITKDFNSLDEKLKATKEGKKLKKTLDELGAAGKKKAVIPPMPQQ